MRLCVWQVGDGSRPVDAGVNPRHSTQSACATRLSRPCLRNGVLRWTITLASCERKHGKRGAYLCPHGSSRGHGRKRRAKVRFRIEAAGSSRCSRDFLRLYAGSGSVNARSSVYGPYGSLRTGGDRGILGRRIHKKLPCSVVFDSIAAVARCYGPNVRCGTFDHDATVVQG
jgi:hypothetical protein